MKETTRSPITTDNTYTTTEHTAPSPSTDPDTAGSSDDDSSTDNSSLVIALIVVCVLMGVLLVVVIRRRSKEPAAFKNTGAVPNPTYAGLGPGVGRQGAIVAADFTATGNGWQSAAKADSFYSEIRPFGAGNADAEIAASYFDVSPLPSRGSRAGSTSSSTLHVKEDEDLYGGFEKKEPTYADTDPLSWPEEDV